MPRLATFIRENTEAILKEWEVFARELPGGDDMDVAALRDHAEQMLQVIVADLETPQTGREQSQKAKGKTDAEEPTQRVALTAAQEHGAGRAESGFSVAQMVAEFRALRASVIRLWTMQQRQIASTDLADMIRFNEAIDQAIAESITRYATGIAQSKDRFLAILGHDLRTPISAIMMSSQFMLDIGELGEPHLSLVSRISSSASRMNQMIADLLDFTRTRFGDSMPIVRTDADIRKIVNDVVAEISLAHPTNTVQIETTGDLRGEWDPARLSQALTNLLANAVYHGSTESPIKLSARGLNDEVTIAVHNNGSFIPKKEINQLFSAMRPVRTGGASDRRHLGLGLYIVEKIASAHGGSVDVRSSKKQGTTFTLHLPRKAHP